MNDHGNGFGARTAHSGVVGVATAVSATVADHFHINPVVVAATVAAVSHLGGIAIARWLKPQRVAVPGNVGALLTEARRLARQLHWMSNRVTAVLAEAEWLASERGVTNEPVPRDRADKPRPGAP